jgi:hypothetical protein
MDVAGVTRRVTQVRTAKTCGPGTPTLVSSLQMVIRRRRWPKSPVHRGERGISRKPSRRECRCLGLPVVYAHVLLVYAREATGAAKHPAFPAPSSYSRVVDAITRAKTRRENAKLWPSPQSGQSEACPPKVTLPTNGGHRASAPLPTLQLGRPHHTGRAMEYLTWLSAKLLSIEAMPSSRVSLFFRNAS